VAVSYVTGAHRVKGGVQYDRSPIREQFEMRGVDTADAREAQPFDPAIGGSPFAFAGRAVGHTVGLYLQDAWSPTENLHLSVGLRADRYRLLVEESAVSPRVGVAYHVHDTGTVLRGSYNRIFMPPFSENLLLSSSLAARTLSPNDDARGEDVRPERQHAFEFGVQQAIGTHVKVDAAYYRKDSRQVADVEQFLDTTVTFPISVSKGVAQGVEARVDVPLFRGVNGYVSLSRATILLTAPLTGGLFLEEPPPSGEEFYADHDQRWQSQFGINYSHPSRRFYATLTGRYDSGIPFELPEDFDPDTFEDPLALSLVDLEDGRARSRALVDVLVGGELFRHGSTNVEAQVGLTNVFNRTYLLNFLSIFNGTHYGMPRAWSARLRVGF
ncbi:MAG: TonB-dependent receptor, partial [Vicinamibacterales bacterium]